MCLIGNLSGDICVTIIIVAIILHKIIIYYRSANGPTSII